MYCGGTSLIRKGGGTMGNTVFYKDVKKNPNKITFKEIMSECTKKHSRRDFDYQLSAGMDFNKATEQDMLQKWQKPWLFYRMFIYGIILMIIIFGLYKIIPKFVEGGGIDGGTIVLATFVPPLIVPLVVVIFFWELNIPRNIALYEVFLSIVVGGAFSFFVNMIANEIGPDKFKQDSAYAGFFEEPAKLIPAIILIILLFKGKKIYGLSGLVIGGAVGAGFSAFEAMFYVVNNTILQGDFHGIAKFYLEWRLLGAFAGHITRAAGYTAAAALHTEKNKFTLSSFLNADFIIMFIASIVTHYINNSNDVHKAIGIIDDSGNFSHSSWIIFKIGLVIVEWLVLLYILRKCLYQVVQRGRYQSGESIGYTEAVDSMGGQLSARAEMAAASAVKITVMGTAGAFKGAVWQSTGEKQLAIGRGDGNTFKLPENVAGISRKHCVIKYTANGWVITDLNSSYGTSVNQVKLAPGVEQPLREGDVIYLGGAGQAFKISYKS